MLSVGLIDKFPVIATGLNAILRDKFEGVTIHTQNNFEDFHQIFKNENLDVIVLSFSERTIDLKFHIIRKCITLFPAVPIILLGEKLTTSEVVSILKAGAKGYVPKQDNLSEIVDCIDAVSKGRHYVNSSIGEEMLNELFVEKKAEPVKFTQLTEKQSSIAKFLSNGMGTSKIAKTLNLKPSTVSTVKAVIFRKMKVNNVIELSNVVRSQMTKGLPFSVEMPFRES